MWALVEVARAHFRQNEGMWEQVTHYLNTAPDESYIGIET